MAPEHVAEIGMKYPIGTRFILGTDVIDTDPLDAGRVSPAGCVWEVMDRGTMGSGSYSCVSPESNGWIYLDEAEFETLGAVFVPLSGEDRCRAVVETLSRKYPEASVAAESDQTGLRVTWEIGKFGKMGTPRYAHGDLHKLANTIEGSEGLDKHIRQRLLDAGIRSHAAVFDMPIALGVKVVHALVARMASGGPIGWTEADTFAFEVTAPRDEARGSMRIGVGESARQAALHALESSASALDVWFMDSEADDRYGFGAKQMWAAVCSGDADRVKSVIQIFGPAVASAGDGVHLRRAAQDESFEVTKALLETGVGVGFQVYVRAADRSVNRFKSLPAAEAYDSQLSGSGTIGVIRDKRDIWPPEVLQFIDRVMYEEPAPGM